MDPEALQARIETLKTELQAHLDRANALSGAIGELERLLNPPDDEE